MHARRIPGDDHAPLVGKRKGGEEESTALTSKKWPRKLCYSVAPHLRAPLTPNPGQFARPRSPRRSSALPVHCGSGFPCWDPRSACPMFASLSTDRVVGGLLQIRRDVVVHLCSAAFLLALWRWLPAHEHGWQDVVWWLGALLTLLAFTLLLGWALDAFVLPNARLSPRGKAVLITASEKTSEP
ncbi:hypothetical protein HPB48_016240 [Haemaphysalis longicornis]|uniref:Uncharacterized protein n=1 Tax=Haemaphysalis longicornis TaxID=44386 RepID=A0A9J6GHL1_HAELO|nr:hypothetical protein HPB48_016240 [Haemaphysalis longicornis]